MGPHFVYHTTSRPGLQVKTRILPGTFHILLPNAQKMTPRGKNLPRGDDFFSDRDYRFAVGSMCQISSAYCRMVRSEENLAPEAMFIRHFLPKDSRSAYSRLARSFASM